ncbi:MAG TPA: T9SS type A sorting domain-containing protein [Bacteroidales bacterium]|nr:T9SS type A sorting domain-containing protein [Bacteroidales bacterium]
MKTLIISLALSILCITSYATVWTITNSGFTFSPATITITLGDSVNFNLGSIHDAVEVDQATWNANGATPLPGGFATPLGGGMVLPDKLTVGTHYYVCSVHVGSSGMKGIITVQNPTNIAVNELDNNISFYPNPVKSVLYFNLNFPETQIMQLRLLNIAGQELLGMEVKNGANNIDLENLTVGLYYVMLTSDKKHLYTTKIILLK